MTRDQLIRLLFRLMKTVPIVELHQAIRYAIDDPKTAIREDATAQLSRRYAEQLVDELTAQAST